MRTTTSRLVLGFTAVLALTAALTAGCGRAIAPTAGRTAQAPSAKQAPAGRWYAVQLHAHSTYSDGHMSVAEMIADAKRAGLDALAITDHNTTAHWLDPDFVAEKELLLLRSQEGDDGQGANHMGLHGLAGITPVLPGPRAGVITEALSRRGTVIINHPKNRMIPWTPLTLDPRASAIEVWNSWFWNPIESDDADLDRGLRPNEEAIDWWAQNLAAGARVAPIAASDFHRQPQSLGSPCTLIYAPERTQDALMAALRSGRTMMVTSARDERIELTADADGDGRFEAMVGDTVPAGAKLRVRVTGGQGREVKVMRGAAMLLKARIKGNDWSQELTLPRQQGQAPFVYARLNGSSGKLALLRAMTGAIYLE